MVSQKFLAFACLTLAVSASALGDSLILSASPSGSQKLTQIDATGATVNSVLVAHKKTGDSYAVGKFASSTGFDIATINNNATSGKGTVTMNRYGASNEYLSTITLGKTPGGFSKIIGTGDFDLDNKLEVVVLNPTAGSRALFLMELQANGTTQTTTIALDPAVSFGTYTPGLGVSDMDGDGDPDLIVQDVATHEIKYLPFAGVTPGTGLTNATLDPSTYGQTSTFVADAIVDVNANGIGDLLSRPDTASQNGKTLWFINATLKKSGASVKYLAGLNTVIGVGKGTLALPIIDVSISMSAFSPKTLNASKGATIRWTNMDFFGHTVTTDVSGSGPNSDVQYPSGMTNGKQYTFTIPASAASGTKFYYHCRFHGAAGNGTAFGTGMVGVIVVN